MGAARGRSFDLVGGEATSASSGKGGSGLVGGSGHWSLPDAGGGVSGDISFWGDDFGRNVLWAIPDGRD